MNSAFHEAVVIIHAKAAGLASLATFAVAPHAVIVEEGPNVRLVADLRLLLLLAAEEYQGWGEQNEGTRYLIHFVASQGRPTTSRESVDVVGMFGSPMSKIARS
jgi:hypothetical protein